MHVSTYSVEQIHVAKHQLNIINERFNVLVTMWIDWIQFTSDYVQCDGTEMAKQRMRYIRGIEIAQRIFRTKFSEF